MDLQSQMEKNTQVMNYAIGMYLDMCLQALDNYSEQKVQTYDVMQKYMNRAASEQEKAAKMFEDMIVQTKKNQQQCQMLMKEATTCMIENFHKLLPNYSTMAGQ